MERRDDIIINRRVFNKKLPPCVEGESRKVFYVIPLVLVLVVAVRLAVHIGPAGRFGGTFRGNALVEICCISGAVEMFACRARLAAAHVSFG